jgi:RNA polymerase sigma-70 factor (ECF subfamily)
VRLFLDALPAIYRLPLIRAEFDDRSVAQIAGELGLGTSAVKSRLARGRALLRARLLACCRFEFDRFGKAIDYERRQPCGCEDPP